MYNEALKLKFIDDYTCKDSTRKVALTLFELTQKFEEEWGADLCTRSEDELQIMANEIAGLKSRSKITKLSILKEYVRWCVRLNVPGVCDGMLKVQENSVGKLREQMVSGPLHLQKCLNKVFSPESLKTIDNIYRCYLWLAFAGMHESDALSITREHVDFVYGVVRYGNTEYPIYKEAIPAFKVVAESAQFQHFVADRETSRDRFPGNELLRGIKRMPSIQDMRTVISKRTLAASKQGVAAEMLTYRRIMMSGLFYRMYEQERAGEVVDFEPIARQTVECSSPSDENNRFYKNKIKVKKEGLETDYARWKLSFQQ